MLFADLGADVVRVDRPSPGASPGAGTPEVQPTWSLRGCRSFVADLKSPEGLADVLALIDRADVLIEGFRPGVVERLGLGPEVCTARNPGLVYARLTGWGQYGPRAHQAGHDINYISITGVLHAIGTAGARPTVPLNLVGDYGGGSLYLVMGALAALHARTSTGRGQVIDAAIVDGATSLAQVQWSMRGAGRWSDQPASNLIDSGRPYYDTYECADGRYVAVGAIEPQFYALLLSGLGLDADGLPAQNDPGGWPQVRALIDAAFRTRSRDEWAAHFATSDACVTPVLTFAEAAEDPHLRARGTVATYAGVPQAGPAPRFSGHTPGEPSAPPQPGAHTGEVRTDWGLDPVGAFFGPGGDDPTA